VVDSCRRGRRRRRCGSGIGNRSGGGGTTRTRPTCQQLHKLASPTWGHVAALAAGMELPTTEEVGRALCDGRRRRGRGGGGAEGGGATDVAVDMGGGA